MPIHVLQVFSTLNNGGAENRIMDVFRHVDQERVVFDFAVVHEGEQFFTREILQTKSKIYTLPDPRKGLLRNYLAWRKFFAEHPFQAVHTHVSWYGGIVLLAAKRAGIPHRVAHARSSEEPSMSFPRKAARTFGRLLFAWTATERLAISEDAARNIFGPACVKRHRYQYVPNSIDQTKYSILDGEDRARLRESLGIPAGVHAYVTVASFRQPKNHMFLLEIAKALREKGDPFLLFLVGDGALRQEIEARIRALGLSEHLRLLGVRGDVPKILCAFDALILPSLYEGLGGVVLEAQMVGVPAIVSTGVPEEANVGIRMVEYVSLQEPPSKWADVILGKIESFSWNRESAVQAFREKGFTIEKTAKQYLLAYGISETTAIDAIVDLRETE